MKLTLLTLLVLLTSCAQEHVVPVETVDKHIKFLSSDEMNGRHPFGEEIKVAENYIIDHFKSLGLKPLPQFPGYKHTFNLTNVEQVEGSAKIEVNKRSVSNFYLVTNSSRSLKNVPVSDFEIEDFSGDERLNLGKFFGVLRGKDAVKKILLISKSHYETIEKSYKRYIPKGGNVIGEKNDRLILILQKPRSLKTVSISAEVNETTYELNNTIAYLEGSELRDEYVMFGAHHDHLAPSKNPDAEDKIFNGADDDASGTTGVLTLAEYFAKNGGNKRSIIFSTFTAEDMGIIGSRELADNFPIDAEKMKAILCMELLGGAAKGGDGNAIITGYEYSDMGQIMQAASDTLQFNLMADPYKGMNLFYRSDNIAFARHGIPSHTVSVTDFTVPDNHYHKVSDEYETMNVANMQRIIMGIARSMKTIISGEETPTRIDKSKIR